MNNKRGQGLIGFFIIEMIFVINWAIWIGGIFSSLGTQAQTAGSQGIELFLWSNINLFIFIFLILVNALVLSYTGSD